jgi:hypothetical protein
MTTEKYDLDLVELSLTGWNQVLKGSIEDIDAFIQTRLLATLGETVAKGDVVYLKSDGKYWKAKAIASQMPARGMAIEAGNTDDEIRIQRVGPITVSGWALVGNPGDKLFVDETTSGTITETRPFEFAQTIGYILSSTSAFLLFREPSPVHYGYSAAPDPPTGYPDGTIYVQLTSATSTTTTTTTV